MLHGVVCVGICSKEENVVWDEASKLISDGLEQKLICVLQDLLSSSHPDQMVYLIKCWCLLSRPCYHCNTVCFMTEWLHQLIQMVDVALLFTPYWISIHMLCVWPHRIAGWIGLISSQLYCILWFLGMHTAF